jgi:ATP-dependent RNA helicase DDX46/PRP5
MCANILAVIMTPTRELCMQIGKECKKFTKSLNLRAVCVYGGTGISEQIAELKRGAEIIVCTPGRMIDLLAANSGGSCLHSDTILVSILNMPDC